MFVMSFHGTTTLGSLSDNGHILNATSLASDPRIADYLREKKNVVAWVEGNKIKMKPIDARVGFDPIGLLDGLTEYLNQRSLPTPKPPAP